MAQEPDVEFLVFIDMRAKLIDDTRIVNDFIKIFDSLPVKSYRINVLTLRDEVDFPPINFEGEGREILKEVLFENLNGEEHYLTPPISGKDIILTIADNIKDIETSIPVVIFWIKYSEPVTLANFNDVVKYCRENNIQVYFINNDSLSNGFRNNCHTLDNSTACQFLLPIPYFVSINELHNVFANTRLFLLYMDYSGSVVSSLSNTFNPDTPFYTALVNLIYQLRLSTPTSPWDTLRIFAFGNNIGRFFNGQLYELRFANRNNALTPPDSLLNFINTRKTSLKNLANKMVQDVESIKANSINIFILTDNEDDPAQGTNRLGPDDIFRPNRRNITAYVYFPDSISRKQRQHEGICRFLRKGLGNGFHVRNF